MVLLIHKRSLNLSIAQTVILTTIANWVRIWRSRNLLELDTKIPKLEKLVRDFVKNQMLCVYDAKFCQKSMNKSGFQRVLLSPRLLHGNMDLVIHQLIHHATFFLIFLLGELWRFPRFPPPRGESCLVLWFRGLISFWVLGL